MPDTYFKTIDMEDTARYHQEVSPRNRLAGQSSIS